MPTRAKPSFSVDSLVSPAHLAILIVRSEGPLCRRPAGGMKTKLNNTDVTMKNIASIKDSRPNAAERKPYPVYVHRAPARDRLAANPWEPLARAAKEPMPDVPASLTIRITGRTPDALSRTTLSVVDVLLTGALMRLRSEEVADTLESAPPRYAGACEPMALTTRAFWIMSAVTAARCSSKSAGCRANVSPGIWGTRRSTASIARSDAGRATTTAT